SPSNALQAYMSPSATSSFAADGDPVGAPATLSSFQSHALSTVHNLAASFGTIATVLAKDQSHTAREEENTRKKLASIQQQLDAMGRLVKEASASSARTSEKATLQARDLNERLNALNNKVIVNL